MDWINNWYVIVLALWAVIGVLTCLNLFMKMDEANDPQMVFLVIIHGPVFWVIGSVLFIIGSIVWICHSVYEWLGEL